MFFFVEQLIGSEIHYVDLGMKLGRVSWCTPFLLKYFTFI